MARAGFWKKDPAKNASTSPVAGMGLRQPGCAGPNPTPFVSCGRMGSLRAVGNSFVVENLRHRFCRVRIASRLIIWPRQ